MDIIEKFSLNVKVPPYTKNTERRIYVEYFKNQCQFQWYSDFYQLNVLVCHDNYFLCYFAS